MSDQDPTPQAPEPPRAQSTTSPADADHGAGDAAPDERTVAGISDDQLPEDLRPGDDNPLAEPLDPEDPATKSSEELGMREEGGTDQDDTAQDDDGQAARGSDSAEAREGGDEGQAGISS
ncbi:hypothetical protein [Nocardioides solisilvae]|uniref:hypothetical protein n=1 Tax=Nocardioides solisilvae TaxID=1542435 RepID=UPI000D748384|nr:hypothetical protein [Nocardioides solisilvae]